MKSWSMALWGKHPSFRDYISQGDHVSFLVPIIQWVQRGHAKLSATQANDEICAGMWKFWIAPEADDLICGLVIASRDVTDRPYPLLIVGHGKLDGKDVRGKSLSRFCRDTWTHMRSIAEGEMVSFDDLLERLSCVPHPGLHEHNAVPAIPPSRDLVQLRQAFQRQIAECRGWPNIRFVLHNGVCLPMTQLSVLEAELNSVNVRKPTMMFFNQDLRAVEFFYRPLQLRDYIRMQTWSKEETHHRAMDCLSREALWT